MFLTKIKSLIMFFLMLAIPAVVFLDFRGVPTYDGSLKFIAEMKSTKKGVGIEIKKNKGIRVWHTRSGYFSKQIYSTKKIEDTYEMAKELKETSKVRAAEIDAMNVI